VKARPGPRRADFLHGLRHELRNASHIFPEQQPGISEMATDYAFIRAYGTYNGTKEALVDREVRRARRENVGDDVYRYDEATGSWRRFSELEAKAEEGDAEVAEMVKKIRAIMR
jgi:hypothetical protein